MTVHTVSSLVEALDETDLLTSSQRAELNGALGQRHNDPRALARDLLHREWLTAFQLNTIFQGRTADLFVDQYLLLERLGEGGMGQVFKARHRKMGRFVALKVLRRDKVDSPEAVRRFYREVQAAAQLSHPNIVAAYDAGEVDGTCFFAMEYIEGADLGKLVKQSGPLPVDAACEYVRQAALGLQHAHEKGMVHRDIKPSNLLLTHARLRTALPPPHLFAAPAGPTIKILDMGLARLHPAFEPDSGGTLTQIHTVLGTPDFIAPEQARSSRRADIRSDLYSLGCTFYYLLTGQVPFPSETPMEKLIKHYLEEPEPVEKLRPAVTPRLARLVRRLMAKNPDDRYQTPAQVVAAVARVIEGGPPTPPQPLRVPPQAPKAPPEGWPLVETLAEMPEFDTDDSLDAPPPPKRSARPRGRAARRFVAALVVILSLVLLGTLLWFRLGT